MHYLSMIPALPRFYVAVAAVFALLAIGIWARFGRHRRVIIQTSETAQMVTMQLGRIADAIDHLAFSIERQTLVAHGAGQAAAPPPPASDAERQTSLTERHVSFSMLGR